MNNWRIEQEFEKVRGVEWEIDEWHKRKSKKASINLAKRLNKKSPNKRVWIEEYNEHDEMTHQMLFENGVCIYEIKPN